MLKGLFNLIVFRVLGGRFMLALAVFGFVRRLLFGRKDRDRGGSDGRLAASAATRVRRS